MTGGEVPPSPFSPSAVRRFLMQRGIRPSRRLGQSFLVDQGTAAKIVAASGLTPGEPCLEIGPGLGALTGVLAAAGAGVTAVEVDRRLADALQETYGDRPGVRIVEGDFLAADMDELLAHASGPARVVANIPYSITTPIIEKLLACKQRLSGIALLVQKEFAERMAAAPGASAFSSLSVFCAYHCDVRLAFTVSRHLFYPAPEVDSALVLLTPLPPRLPPREEDAFFRALRAAFSQRRKKALNALSDGLGLSKVKISAALDGAGIGAEARAQHISLQQYLLLARRLAALQAPGPG